VEVSFSHHPLNCPPLEEQKFFFGLYHAENFFQKQSCNGFIPTQIYSSVKGFFFGASKCEKNLYGGFTL